MKSEHIASWILAIATCVIAIATVLGLAAFDKGTWIIAIATCILAVVTAFVMIGVVTGILPTTAAITKVGITIAKESVEKVIEAVVSYRENPGGARRSMYKEALKQAFDKGYLTETLKGGYITADEWKGANRLLTESERTRIDGIINSKKDADNNALIELAHSQLIGELKRDIKIGSKTIHLSPYDKIGIIGGYICEVRAER